jgi:hypothetical protein
MIQASRTRTVMGDDPHVLGRGYVGYTISTNQPIQLLIAHPNMCNVIMTT